MENIEVDCFICGSQDIINGVCMHCGYKCDVEFRCPYHNGFASCNVTRKLCSKPLDYYDCETYKKFK